MANIQTIVNEPERGCGFRKAGGLYLMAGKPNAPCGKLPLELTVCPCCGQGIKPARGWTWVNGRELAGNVECPNASQETGFCPCPMWDPAELVGLIWVGEKYYKTADHFMGEARDIGISRRITAVPHDFKLGETWVWLAHRKAIEDFDAEKHEVVYKPGVFTAFMPERIEYVVKGTETEEELDRMEARGITLVRLARDVFDQEEVENLR